MSIDEAGEQIEEASDDADSTTKWFARGWVATLALVIIAVALYAHQTGILALSVTPSASPDITSEVELLVRGLVYIFLGFTAIMALVAAPGSYLNAISGVVGRFLHGYTDNRYVRENDDGEE